MILEVDGAVQLHSASGANKAALPQALLYLDDRLTLSAHAQVQLVYLSDLHKERLKPGRDVTIDFKGSEPADSVLERDNSILMTFVRLPKGTFYMGWDDTLGNKGVQTTIQEDFEIAVLDVTQGQWEGVMGNNPSYYSPQHAGAGKDVSDEELKLFPVDSVSWDDVQAFIKKLNEKERGREYLYRLPTEAEWEHACRGGATSEEECSYHFYFARPTNDLSSEQANFNGSSPFGKAPKGKNLGRPTRVGAYPPNKLGLCDMHGNMWQWCDGRQGIGGLSLARSDRVIRGGCWNGDGKICRAASRIPVPATAAVQYVTFRRKRSRGEGDGRTVGNRDRNGHSAAIVAAGNTGRWPSFNADYVGPGGRLFARVSPLGAATLDETQDAAACRTFPERVCQAENGFPPGGSVTGARGESYVHFGLVGRDESCVLVVVTSSGFVSVVVATGSGDRSLLTRLLPTHSFARYRSR
jgi:formylglycine-generating enzyme required for sulfatase activity